MQVITSQVLKSHITMSYFNDKNVGISQYRVPVHFYKIRQFTTVSSTDTQKKPTTVIKTIIFIAIHK